MATSRFESEQYFSENFVESVGAVLFRLSTREVCIVHLRSRDECVLAKGRRNLGEARKATALREVMEETGYACRILPVAMSTRNPPAIETGPVPDEPRLHAGAQEHFALQYRRLAEEHVKLIWWYIASVDEEEEFKEDIQGRDRFGVEFHSYSDVLEKLTFEMDRDMVKKAIDIVEGTYGGDDDLPKPS